MDLKVPALPKSSFMVASHYIHVPSNDVVVLFRRGSQAKQYLADYVRRRSVSLSPDFVVDTVVSSHYIHARSKDVVVLFRRGSHAKQYLPTNLQFKLEGGVFRSLPTLLSILR